MELAVYAGGRAASKGGGSALKVAGRHIMDTDACADVNMQLEQLQTMVDKFQPSSAEDITNMLAKLATVCKQYRLDKRQQHRVQTLQQQCREKFVATGDAEICGRGNKEIR